MRPRVAGVMALLAAGAAAGPAAAYVRTTTEDGHPMKWGHHCIPLTLYVGDPPRFLDEAAFVNAAKAAGAVWSHEALACSQLRITFTTSPEASADVAFDYKNRITFRREEWCKQPRKVGEPCYDSSALAITSVYARKSDGTILDSDMEINAKSFVWADVTTGDSNAAMSQDVQNTITHEIGHLIGLDHTCYMLSDRPRPKNHLGEDVPDCSCFLNNGRPPTKPDARCVGATARAGEATMYAAVSRGDVSRRDLSPDDLQAVCDIYPATSNLPCAPTDDDSGCRVAPPGGATGTGNGNESTPSASRPLLALAAIGLAGMFIARRRRPRR